MGGGLKPKDYEWTEDGTICITYRERAAHSRQLGACWAGYFVQMLRENKELQELVGLNPDYYVSGALLLGKPLFKKTKKTPPRKEREIIWT